MFRLPPKVYQFLVGVFASLGSFLYGFDLGVIAGATDSENFRNKFDATDAEHGAVVALFTAGAFFGGGAAGYVGDAIGRKLTILTGAVIFVLGGSLQAGARNLEFLYAGRAIAGLGVGFLVMIVPLYQAELAHPSIRGRITGLQQFMLGLGSLTAAWVSWGCYTGFPADNENQWRVPLGLQVPPAGILALLIMLFPESPRWLADKGRNDEALKTLAKLHAHGDVNDVWVQAEYSSIVDSVTYEREHEAKSYAELFTNKASFRRLLLACSIQAAVQMTGVSAIQYYSPDIFRQIGISGDDTLKYQGISSILAVIGQALCLVVIDRVGRRWWLIGGNLGNCVTFIIATILLAMFPPGDTNNTSASWGFIVITWIYNFCFSATCGPMSWIVPSEIFDTKTRAKGVSIGVMVSFAFNTLIGQVTPVALDRVGWRYYILFVVCNLTNAIWFWMIQPETKKRPLETMNYLFTNAPWFIPTADMKAYEDHELEQRMEQIERKGSVQSASSHKELPAENKEVA